ncbi:hypothetical protein Drorol1_Dr00011883 [Drosera rotundifolia]
MDFHYLEVSDSWVVFFFTLFSFMDFHCLEVLSHVFNWDFCFEWLGLKKDVIACEKNLVVSVHRPITRKFAAQFAYVRHFTSEFNVLTIKNKGTKKPKQARSSSIEPDDCNIIDVEDSEALSDLVPLFVQHTEAMLAEMDRMDEEIEMEDVDEDHVLDIDDLKEVVSAFQHKRKPKFAKL